MFAQVWNHLWYQVPQVYGQCRSRKSRRRRNPPIRRGGSLGRFRLTIIKKAIWNVAAKRLLWYFGFCGQPNPSWTCPIIYYTERLESSSRVWHRQQKAKTTYPRICSTRTSWRCSSTNHQVTPPNGKNGWETGAIEIVDAFPCFSVSDIVVRRFQKLGWCHPKSLDRCCQPCPLKLSSAFRKLPRLQIGILREHFTCGKVLCVSLLFEGWIRF